MLLEGRRFMTTFRPFPFKVPALVFAVTLCLAASTATARQRKAHRPSTPPAEPSDQTLAIQVALDKAGFSPGEIDGRSGAFTTRALQAFRDARGLSAAEGAPIDQAAIAALGDAYAKPLVSYTVTEADVAGPFQDIPKDMGKKARLPALGYSSALEELAERFHASPALITRLNPGVALAAGANITVPAVEPFHLPERQGARPAAETRDAPAARVEITKESGAVVVRDAQGMVLMYAPVTVGSEHDPLPVGDWKIVSIFDLPKFSYNPDLFWDADPSHGKALLPAGPNNPVGVIWIQINKEHFGLHGTPEPSQIGRTESHGCIRMTNWDVVRFASLVRNGTPVILR
jgi:lipoprotein-anchoring transpeptidase ErfK/SrfK